MKKKIAGLALLLSGIAHAQKPTALELVLEKYKQDKELKHATFSYYVCDAKTGQSISTYQPEMGVAPASTLKVITTSAALGILGKNFCYETQLCYTGTLDNGVIKGDLIIVGSGDPSLNSSYFKESQSVAQQWATVLKQKGIRKIEGKIIADASCFDKAIPDTWVWGDISNYYGAAANGLSYNDNKFSVFFTSGAAGEPASVKRMQPLIRGLELDNHITAGGTGDNAYLYGDPNGYARTMTGTVPPQQKEYEVEGVMPEPGLFCASELLQALKDLGITASGPEPIVLYEVPVSRKKDYQLLYTHKSPPLEKLLYYTNLKSNNHYAESLLKTLGARASGQQGTTSKGIEAVIAFWKSRGLDTDGLFMSDGSGLSRFNTVTTRLQATLLSKLYRDTVLYKVMNASLPVAGVNGSMSSLCKGSFAEKNLRAKTGYITRVRGYCGYVKTKAGKELAFSILFNNYDCSPKEMKEKIEWWMVALTEL